MSVRRVEYEKSPCPLCGHGKNYHRDVVFSGDDFVKVSQEYVPCQYFDFGEGDSERIYAFPCDCNHAVDLCDLRSREWQPMEVTVGLRLQPGEDD